MEPMTVKKPLSSLLIKAGENPLITPKTENFWEYFQTFNPGVILLDGRVHFIYRAIGVDGVSRFGYASSRDGFHIDERLPYPVYEHRIVTHLTDNNPYASPSGGELYGAEDPRLVRIDGEPSLYMTYTVYDGRSLIRMALTSISINDFLDKKWNWKPSVFISPEGETHKNWVIFPEKINGKYAILYGISPEVRISLLDDINISKPINIIGRYNGIPIGKWKNGWEGYIRGVGPPPIKTEYGWLVFYHAHSRDDFARYKVGVMLLDVKDPSRILCKAKEPILEPTAQYENSGFKPGIIYVTGAIVKDGLLTLYYGSADSYVCAAYTDLKEFLETLIEESTVESSTGSH